MDSDLPRDIHDDDQQRSITFSIKDNYFGLDQSYGQQNNFLMPQIHKVPQEVFLNGLQQDDYIDSEYHIPQPQNQIQIPDQQIKVQKNVIEVQSDESEVKFLQINYIIPLQAPLILEIPKKQNPFNNMPGFSIGGFHSKIQEIIKYGQKIQNQTVKECFMKLIDNVFKKISCKNGSRIQLRMLLNDIDQNINKQIKKKQIKKKQIKKKQIKKKQQNLDQCEIQYFNILATYDQKTINEAKYHLRQAALQCMDQNWILNHAKDRNFGKKNIQEKGRNFYKYLINLKKQLSQGSLVRSINKKDLDNIQVPF